MFTGIIECIGLVKNINVQGSNHHFTIESRISKDLKVDQSVSHNGVCLTVIAINNNTHEVVAINETLQKTNLNSLKIDSAINLERCMLMNGRLDGHIVQGHIDGKASCKSIIEENGSWIFTFELSDPLNENLIVEKGSICIDGVSLTAFNVKQKIFQVAIIPYTFHHTTFQFIEKNKDVNIEFDIIGKYIKKLVQK